MISRTVMVTVIVDRLKVLTHPNGINRYTDAHHAETNATIWVKYLIRVEVKITGSRDGEIG